MHLILVFVICISLYSGLKTRSDAARTKEKIYVTLDGYGGCFRRLNGTQEIGCSSGRSGNVGVIHFVRNEDDLEWMIMKGPHAPYAVFLVGSMFQSEIVMRVTSSGKANGILTNNTVEEAFPAEFSPDDSCPNNANEYYGDTYGSCSKETWNPPGNRMVFEDFDLPIMILTNSTEVEDLFEDCLERNQPGATESAPQYPLCGAEIKDVMDAAVDTPTCIRRSNLVTNLSPQTYCDPLGDYNVYSLMQPYRDYDSRKKVLVAATRMDSFSMFYGLYPSADSAVSGLVTLLAAAQALGPFKHEFKDADRKLMFTFFNGEAFEYMGSSRMVYDMKNGQFPSPPEDIHVTPHLIVPEDIDGFIELAQVGKLDQGKLWIHTDPISRQETSVNTKVEALIDDLKDHPSIDVELEEVTVVDQPLPPASLQSFLKDTKVPGVVITDHETKYTNKYYNSMYDVASNINLTYPNVAEEDMYDHISEAAVHLTKVAELVARTLYRQSGLNTSHITVDPLDVAHLLYCFAHSPICDLFNKTIDPYYAERISKKSFLYYVGVGINGGSINYVRHMTKQLLSYFLGDRVTLKKDDCRKEDFKDDDDADYDRCCKNLKAHTEDRIFKYIYINDINQSNKSLKCVKSLVNVSEAKSPAFDIKNYDWDSNQYPAWSESRWPTDGISFRYFLIPPRSMEIGVLCFSIFLFIGCLVGAYFLEKRAKFIFHKETTILEECYDGDCMNGYGAVQELSPTEPVTT